MKVVRDPWFAIRRQQLSRKYNDMVREDACRRGEKHKRGKRTEKERMTEVPAVVEPEIITKSVIFEAQALYMRFVSLSRIAEETGVGKGVLQKYVYGENGWKAQRDAVQKEITEQVKVASLSQLRQAAGISLHLINLALEDVAKKCKEAGEAPDLREAEVIAGIFSKLHKAKVVEEMDEDEKKKIGMSPAEILKTLGADPYLRKAIAIHSESTLEVDDDPDTEPPDDLI